MRRDLGFEFCRSAGEKNPFVAGPLKRTDCSMLYDGAAALMLADTNTASSMQRAVKFRGIAHVQDFLPMSKRDVLKLEGCSLAWQQVLSVAQIQMNEFVR